MHFSAVALASALGIIPVSASATTSTTTPSKQQNERIKRKRRRNVETSANNGHTTFKLKKLPTTKISAVEYLFGAENRLTNVDSLSFETCTLLSQSGENPGDLDLGILKKCSDINDACILPNLIGYQIDPSKSNRTSNNLDTVVGVSDSAGEDDGFQDFDTHSTIAMGICYPRESLDDDYLRGTTQLVEEHQDAYGYYGKYYYYDGYGYYGRLLSFGKRLFSGKESEAPTKGLRNSATIQEDVKNNAITKKDAHYLKCQQYCAGFEIPQIAEWLQGKTPGGDWPMFEELVANCIHQYKYESYMGLTLTRSNCPFNFTKDNEWIPFNCWNTTGVTNFETAFRKQKWFNKPIDCWDVSSVTSTRGMFTSAYSFDQDLSMWDMSNVEDLSSMFYFAVQFNNTGNSLERWDTSSATDASKMFFGANQFNAPLDGWDFSNVKDMYRMFFAAQTFNQPIGRWDVSSLTAIDSVFVASFAFNQPLENWNTSSVTSLNSAFMNAYAFNQPLAKWDVSNVQNMDYTFLAALKFNQPLDDDEEHWNVQSATSMKQMFFRTSFNQCVGTWADQLSAHEDVDETSTFGMLYQAACPVQNHMGTPPFNQGPWCQDETNGCSSKRAILHSKATKKDKKGIKSTKSAKSQKHRHIT